MEKFTRELRELFVNKNLDLTGSLKILSSRKDGKVQKTAAFIVDAMGKGTKFSGALKICPYIRFDESYITFVVLAESVGNLKDTIDYLDKKLKRSRSNKETVLMASIYPAVVILLALGLSIAFSCIMKTLNLIEIVKNAFWLVVICFLIFVWLFKLLGVSKAYEAFLGTDLLLKGGIPLSTATECGALIAGTETKVGKMFIEASEKIEFGMSVTNAFKSNKYFEEMIYIAEVSCGEDKLFESVAGLLEEKKQKERAVCMKLIEPVFIILTGVYIALTIKNTFLPEINNLEWLFG